jgi:hypothetical protein
MKKAGLIIDYKVFSATPKSRTARLRKCSRGCGTQTESLGIARTTGGGDDSRLCRHDRQTSFSGLVLLAQHHVLVFRQPINIDSSVATARSFGPETSTSRLLGRDTFRSARNRSGAECSSQDPHSNLFGMGSPISSKLLLSVDHGQNVLEHEVFLNLVHYRSE